MMGIFYAVRNRNQSAKDLKGTIIYMLDKQKTVVEGMSLNSGFNCTVPSVFDEMMSTKGQHRKANGRMFYQFVQSFPKDTKLSPQEIHQMGLEFAQKQFPQFEVLISTHTNTENLHNHILVNSVSFQTGKKLHQNHDNLLQHRMVNDELCLKFGDTPLPKYQKGQKNKGMKSGEYRSAKRGESYKIKLMNTIDDCMKFAKDQSHFVYLMESEGYAVLWEKGRKSITYTTPDAKKCRDYRLHEEKYFKERMELEFEIRREIIAGGIEKSQQATGEFTRENFGASQCGGVESEGIGNKDFRKSGIDRGAATEPTTPSEARRCSEPDQQADTDTAGADPDQQAHITGWEAQREGVFSAENQTSPMGMDTDAPTDYSMLAPIVGGAVGLVALAESSHGDAPIKDATTMPQPKRKGKKGVAQNKEDEQEQNYSHTMSMY